MEETNAQEIVNCRYRPFACVRGRRDGADLSDLPDHHDHPVRGRRAAGHLSRVVAQRLSEILGQQVVIENIGGAGGMTGSKRVADAAPDGYTFGVGSVGTHAQNQTLYKKPAYNSATDFTPIALMAETPIALTVRKDLPVNNFKEFVAYAKANHEKMQFGSAGPARPPISAASCSTPFWGSTPRTFPIADRPGHAGPARRPHRLSVRDHQHRETAHRLGAIKALAIMTKERSPVLPDLPTALEQGTPNLEAYTWSAAFMPKGAPEDAANKLNAAIVQSLKTPAVRDRLLDGCPGRHRRPDDAAISRRVREERDREVGGADQGQRRER